MNRLLEVFSEVSWLRVDRKKLRAMIAQLDEYYQPKNHGALSVAFVAHERLAQMHEGFCGDPSPTDIITFPAGITEQNKETFGELCVSAQAAVDYIKKHGGSFEEELKRYVVHGYLHLLGYDDLNPKDKRKMRREERRALELLKKVHHLFSLKH